MLRLRCGFAIAAPSSTRFVSSRIDDAAAAVDPRELPFWQRCAAAGGIQLLELRRIKYVLLDQPAAGTGTYNTVPTAAYKAHQLAGIGSRAYILRGFVRLRNLFRRGVALDSVEGAGGSSALELAEGAKEARIDLAKRLHRMPYKRRLIVVPGRHIGWAVSNSLLNMYRSVFNGLKSLFCIPIFKYVDSGESLSQAVVGVGTGVAACLAYLFIGFVVSPLIHFPNGLANGFVGFWNSWTWKKVFDPSSGRFIRANVTEAAFMIKALEESSETIRLIGEEEWMRSASRREEKHARMFGIMKEHIEQRFGMKFGPSQAADTNPYKVLGVERTATATEIKLRYLELVKTLHPDARPGDPTAKERFESIVRAYRLLSSPRKRKEFDCGGARVGQFMEQADGFLQGTPLNIFQLLIGGKIFEDTITGTLYRTLFLLKQLGHCSVSIHSFECFWSVRNRVVSTRVARMLDHHARATPAGDKGGQKPKIPPPPSLYPTRAMKGGFATCHTNAYDDFSADFINRCERFARLLSEAPYGKELLYEIGQIYIVVAKFRLGLMSTYAFKRYFFDKVVEAMMAAPSLEETLGPERHLACRVFMFTFGDGVGELYLSQKQILCAVLNDVGCATSDAEAERVQRRRAHAMWLLGESMLRRGVSHWSSITKDVDVVNNIVLARQFFQEKYQKIKNKEVF